jgi:hypothetical protein
VQVDFDCEPLPNPAEESSGIKRSIVQVVLVEPKPTLTVPASKLFVDEVLVSEKSATEPAAIATTTAEPAATRNTHFRFLNLGDTSVPLVSICIFMLFPFGG